MKTFQDWQKDNIEEGLKQWSQNVADVGRKIMGTQDVDPTKVMAHDETDQKISEFAKRIGMVAQQIPLHGPLWMNLFYLVQSLNGGDRKAITRAQIEPIWKAILQNGNPMHINSPLGMMRVFGNIDFRYHPDVTQFERETSHENKTKRQQALQNPNMASLWKGDVGAGLVASELSKLKITLGRNGQNQEALPLIDKILSMLS